MAIKTTILDPDIRIAASTAPINTMTQVPNEKNSIIFIPASIVSYQAKSGPIIHTKLQAGGNHSCRSLPGKMCTVRGRDNSCASVIKINTLYLNLNTSEKINIRDIIKDGCENEIVELLEDNEITKTQLIRQLAELFDIDNDIKDEDIVRHVSEKFNWSGELIDYIAEDCNQ
jgi:hypothetical protein